MTEMETYSARHLNALRSAELECVIDMFPPAARVLEIGAGSGEQAALLAARGFDVCAIDVAQSPYTERSFPVAIYDGGAIPFPDASFDVVFSSNVLEHIRDLDALHREARRVLRADGCCIHVVPTPAWRAWTIVSSGPTAALLAGRALGATRTGGAARAWGLAAKYAAAAVLQPRHGERGWTGYSELWLFRPGWWRNDFHRNGFRIVAERPVGLFYTGNGLFGPGLSFARRAALSRRLGSACHAFKLALS
jgi:SAM-dependent methyltransferase